MLTLTSLGEFPANRPVVLYGASRAALVLIAALLRLADIRIVAVLDAHRRGQVSGIPVMGVESLLADASLLREKPFVVIACRYVEEAADMLGKAALNPVNGWPLASFLLDLVDAAHSVPPGWEAGSALAVTRATYARDGLITMHNADFVTHGRFAEALAATAQVLPEAPGVAWRAAVACWAADIASRLPGDFVECGVNRGVISYTVTQYLKFWNLDKKFFLLDTYSGLVPELLTETERSAGFEKTYEDCYVECYEDTKGRFSHIPNAHLIRGIIPDTLPSVPSRSIAYLHIDMNSAIPELAAAEFFWPKLVSGGMMLLDDYGWTGHEEQKRQFDEFASARGVSILSLPTGQGMAVKI